MRKLHVSKEALAEAEASRRKAADEWWRDNELNLRSGYEPEQIAREAFEAGWTASSEEIFKRVAEKILGKRKNKVMQ